MTKRLRVCDAAEAVLRETKNPAVMWGDCHLLDDIAERAGVECKPVPWGIVERHERVLAALSRTPGKLIKGSTLTGGNRRVRIFWLEEHVPEQVLRARDLHERLSPNERRRHYERKH